MVRILFIIGYFSELLCCCISNNTKKEELFDNYLPYYQINNEILEYEIGIFIDSLKKNYPKNIIVKSTIIQYLDTTIYYLSNATSAFGIINSLTIFSHVKGNIVAFTFFEMQDNITLTDSISWKYLKDIFPDEYKYYQENNDYLPPLTGGGLECRLIFIGDSLVSKQMYSSQ